MLLSELYRDNERMLKKLNVTREKENQYLQENNLFLSDILYNEKHYNNFVEWLKKGV